VETNQWQPFCGKEKKTKKKSQKKKTCRAKQNRLGPKDRERLNWASFSWPQCKKKNIPEIKKKKTNGIWNRIIVAVKIPVQIIPSRFQSRPPEPLSLKKPWTNTKNKYDGEGPSARIE